MAADSLGQVDERWFPIIKEALKRAAGQEPFLTFLAVLATIVILAVVPLWLVVHYRYLSLRAKHRAEFARLRYGQRQA